MERKLRSRIAPEHRTWFAVAISAALFGCASGATIDDTGKGGGNGTGTGGGSAGGSGAGGTSATTGAGGTSATTGAGGTSATTGAGGTSATTGAGGTSATTGAGGTSATTGAGGRGGGGGGAAGTGAGGMAGTGTGGAGGTTAASNVYYIAPNGNDSNPGTMASPFFTLQKGASIFKSGTGGQLWVMPGTYMYANPQNLTSIGTAANPINVYAMPGGSRPILDFSGEPRGTSTMDNNRGIELKGYYYHIKGLDIRNASDNGINITGGFNTLEDLLIHANGDTGLQITATTDEAGDNTKAANNLILNCDSYENIDVATGGENADGFAAKLRIGPGNVFRGCRAWANADDGWDLFAANDIVVIDNCWSFLNGKPPGGNNPSGDGNGFKLGGMPDGTADQGGAIHKVTGCSAFDNLACGFVRNNNPDNPSVSTCGVHNNPNGDYCKVTCTPSKTLTTTGNAAKAIARNADGSLPALN